MDLDGGDIFMSRLDMLCHDMTCNICYVVYDIHDITGTNESDWKDTLRCDGVDYPTECCFHSRADGPGVRIPLISHLNKHLLTLVTPCIATNITQILKIVLAQNLAQN